MTEENIVLVDGARTPTGSFGGMFKDVPGYELGATAAKAALERAGVAAEAIGEVVMGCIGQVGPDAYNARRVAIAAGLPKNVPAYTVKLRWGGTDFALAGGDESMSRMPFYEPAAGRVRCGVPAARGDRLGHGGLRRGDRSGRGRWP